MNTSRKRISGRLDQSPRGLVIITESSEHWVLEDFEPDNDLLGKDVVAEGTVTGLDRLQVDWIGAS